MTSPPLRVRSRAERRRRAASRGRRENRARHRAPEIRSLVGPTDPVPKRNAPRGGNDRRLQQRRDRKSTRLNSSHVEISYAVFCLKKKKKIKIRLFVD